MRKHYVRFFSPGTMFAEETSKPIESWDTKIAVQMAKEIRERHGAKPYGFQFITCLEGEPVPDGEGGLLKTESKQVDKSGMHYLGGMIFTIEEIEAAPKNQNLDILANNMKCNDWPFVVRNQNSWLTFQPFREEDCVVDPETGVTIEAGNTLERIQYRAKKIAEHKAEMGKCS